MRCGVKTLTKKKFDKAITNLWTLSRIREEYVIHSRVWYASLKKYGDKDWKGLESARRSRVMRGNKNGCRPPTHLPEKEELIEAIKSGLTQKQIREKFKGGERLFHRWLEWLGLCELWNTRFDHVDYKWTVDEDCVQVLQALYPGININNLSCRDMRGAQRKLLHVSDHIKRLGQLKQKREGKVKGISWSKNQAEIIVEECLESKGIKYIRSPEVEGYYLDFYLPCYDLYIEVDGSIHEIGDKKDRDIKIDNLMGGRLLRLRSRTKSQKTWQLLNEDLSLLMERLCL